MKSICRTACALAVASLSAMAAAGTPEVPKIRPLAMYAEAVPGNGQPELEHPVVPPFRTTSDGRVALDLKKQKGRVTFYVMNPERLLAPISTGPAGIRMVDASSRATLNHLDLYDDGTFPGTHAHTTICDAKPALRASGATRNPYNCRNGDDCYDVTLIATVDRGTNGVDIWGTDITIRVDNPKTSGASIADITINSPPVRGANFSVNDFFEPQVTEDGRLLVGRIGKSEIPVNINGQTKMRRIEIVYSTYTPEEGDPCDVTLWDEIRPISQAYGDPDMHGRYGIAAQPFRDAENNPIGDGDDLGGSYPWIDSEGNNLLFSTIGEQLYYDAGAGNFGTRYPASCVTGYTCNDGLDNGKNFRGVGVAGSWSRGKIVLVDNILNNTDHGLGRTGETQRMLALYVPSVNHSGSVRVGTGRSNGPPDWVRPNTQNTEFIESLENRFNYRELAKPVTIRDVVWHVSTGKATAEVAFDDVVNPNSFLIAEMTGSLSKNDPTGTRDYTRLKYWDGWDGSAFTEEIHLQNAATADHWRIPSYGLVHGDVRLEPVALGGIVGKGVWLDGDAEDGVEFAIHAQPNDVGSHDWYVSLFLNPRFDDDGVERNLLTFPDGSRVALLGLNIVRMITPAGATGDIVLPAGSVTRAAWAHFGFLVRRDAGGIDFHVNGYKYASAPYIGAVMQLVPGSLWLGADGTHPGPRGWLDELKVFARDPGPEVTCNHARGTLVAVDQSSDPTWQAVASAYPVGSHDEISAQLTVHGKPTAPQYACFVDYNEPRNVTLDNLPTGTVSVRGNLLFPEGPLRYGAPRPDSTTNVFCQSCHNRLQTVPGLSPAALQPGTVNMEDDPRRQPSQPPQLLFGNVPAGFFDGTMPRRDQVAPPDGFALDKLVY